MKDKEIIDTLKDIGENNFVTFSEKRIEEIKKVIEEVQLQMIESIGIKKEDLKEEQH